MEEVQANEENFHLSYYCQHLKHLVLCIRLKIEVMALQTGSHLNLELGATVGSRNN